MRAAKIFAVFSGGGELPSSIRALFSFLWLGDVSGNELVDVIAGNNITVTNKDFSDIIPSTSSATLAMANVAALKTDDGFDGAWFDDAGTPKTVTPAQLIGNDYSRTIVKYDHESPYNIRWIGILDDGVTLTSDQINALHLYFQLHIFWSGGFSDYGYLKDNKPLEGQGYKGWIAEVQSLSLTEPSTLVKASVNKLALDLINYGVSGRFDRFWNFMLNDGNLFSGAGSVSLFNPGATRMSFPVSPTGSTRGMIGNGSSQYALDNFNPTSDGVNWTLNSASIGLFFYSAKTIATSYMHGAISSAIDIVTVGNSSTLQRVNGGNLGPAVSLDGADYVALNRSGATATQIYRNAVQSTGSGSSSGLTNQSFVTLRSQFGYGDNGLSMKYLGASFTQTEHSNIRTAFLAHKTRLGL